MNSYGWWFWCTGYGLFVKGSDLLSKNKSGKALMNLQSSEVMLPSPIADLESNQILAITNQRSYVVVPN